MVGGFDRGTGGLDEEGLIGPVHVWALAEGLANTMHKRNRILGILGAGVLTLGVVGIALAVELKDAHEGITVGWDENGDPFAEDANGDPFPVNPAECQGFGVEEGEIVFHFVQSGEGFTPNDGGAAANLLDVDFEDEADQSGIQADSVHSNNVDWFASVSPADGEVILVTANSNIDGGELRLSHICVGEAPGEEATPTPVPPTDTPAPPTDTPPPSFEQSQAADTDAPTEPNTATVGANGTSAPADSAWLLVVALGVLLSSIVVLTPARARTRR